MGNFSFLGSVIRPPDLKCSSEKVVYLLICKTCSKQFTWSTGDFRQRFTETFWKEKKINKSYLTLILQRLTILVRIIFLFFLSGFSFTDTDDSQDSRGRGPSFIPLYQFHPLTNIQIFICSFACEMTITYF